MEFIVTHYLVKALSQFSLSVLLFLSIFLLLPNKIYVLRDSKIVHTSLKVTFCYYRSNWSLIHAV